MAHLSQTALESLGDRHHLCCCFGGGCNARLGHIVSINKQHRHRWEKEREDRTQSAVAVSQYMRHSAGRQNREEDFLLERHLAQLQTQIDEIAVLLLGVVPDHIRVSVTAHQQRNLSNETHIYIYIIK